MIEFLCWLIVVFFSHNCITKPIQNLRNNKIITARYNKISDTYEESILDIDAAGILSRFKSDYKGLFKVFNS